MYVKIEVFFLNGLTLSWHPLAQNVRALCAHSRGASLRVRDQKRGEHPARDTAYMLIFDLK